MLDFNLLRSYQMHQMYETIEINEMMENINKAFEISKNVLRDAYNNNGIKAGQTHFSDVWIRDSCFAGWGAIAVDDISIVENFLIYTLNNMNAKGQCPLRIGQINFLLKYIGIKGKQGPTFIEDKYVSIPMDSNSLTIILFYKYLNKTKNNELGIRYYNKLKNAILWYKNHKKNNLIVEGHYAGWADSIKKKGHVLYTNALYYEALNSMAKIAEMFNFKTDTQLFNEISEKVKNEMNNVFWNGSYLNDWVDGKKQKKTFSMEGNMLAILFGVVSKDKVNKICNYVLSSKMITPYGCPVVYKKYSWHEVYAPFLFIGLKDYHNGLIWFWISCIASIAFFKNGYEKEGLDLLNKIAIKVNKDKTIYEVYTKKGKPMKNLFYRSEEGFAWSAGLFVWAYQELANKDK